MQNRWLQVSHEIMDDSALGIPGVPVRRNLLSHQPDQVKIGLQIWGEWHNGIVSFVEAVSSINQKPVSCLRPCWTGSVCSKLRSSLNFVLPNVDHFDPIPLFLAKGLKKSPSPHYSARANRHAPCDHRQIPRSTKMRNECPARTPTPRVLF